MSIDFSTLDEVDELLKIPLRLDSNQDFYIRLMYGDKLQMPIFDKFPKMLTTEEMMHNAGREILKFQEKGFLTLSEKAENPGDIFKRSIYATKAKETSEKPKADKTIKLPTTSEPFQKFWLSSHIVTKTIHEIRALPYFDHYDKFDVEQKFIDQVSSVTRLMKHDGLLDDTNQSKQQLYSTMRHFVTQTIQIRSNLLGNYIKNEKIDFSKLTESQKKEFASFEPQKNQLDTNSQDNQSQALKQNDFDTKMLDHINATTSKLPKLYKFTNFCTDEASRTRVKKQMINSIIKSSKIIMDALNRPAKVNTKRSSLKVNETFVDEYEEEEEEEENQSDNSDTFSSRKTSRFESNLWKSKHPIVITNPTQKKKETKNISIEESFKDVKLSDKTIHTHYWRDNDPLECTRGGNYISQLDKIDEFMADVELDGAIFDISEIEMPFALESEKNKPVKPRLIQPKLYKPIVPTKQFLDSFSSQFEADESNNDIAKKDNKNQEEEEEENEEEDNDIKICQNDNNDKLSSMFSTSVRRQAAELGRNGEKNYDIGCSNKDDMKLLMEQTKELTKENTGLAVHDKLDEIWEKLGFSITQKLEMVVKYSKDVEESSKMHEALSLWETALSFSEQYENCYNSMKDFLKLEAANASYAGVTIANMKAEMAEVVDSLKQVAGRLRQSYNDELIINRKTISQLVYDHQIKLRFLCKDLNIDFDNL